MASRVLVHGADNFVGRKLVSRLREADGGTVIEVRGGDATELSRRLADADCVAHCIVGSAADIERGTAALYESTALRTRLPPTVHLGSMTVYGSAQGLVKESAPLLADVGPYSQAQRNAEMLAARSGVAVVLRAGVEYGPDCAAWSGRVARWLRARRLGDLGEWGDGICNLVYIDDLVAVIHAALGHPGGSDAVFNVAAPNKVTWNEYLIGYAIALGAVPVRRVGARRLRLETRLAAPLLRAAQIAARATGIGTERVPPPIPPSLLGVCGQAIDLATDKLAGSMSIRWTTLEAGLCAAARCYG